jgi:hypothetical protein
MIKPVYRVQCDGPGKEWLALSEEPATATGLVVGDLVATTTARRAATWVTEKEAVRAAVSAGWRHPVNSPDFKDWLCPECQSASPDTPRT